MIKSFDHNPPTTSVGPEYFHVLKNHLNSHRPADPRDPVADLSLYVFIPFPGCVYCVNRGPLSFLVRGTRRVVGLGYPDQVDTFQRPCGIGLGNLRMALQGSVDWVLEASHSGWKAVGGCGQWLDLHWFY
jgi:hypothetical protein